MIRDILYITIFYARRAGPHQPIRRECSGRRSSGPGYQANMFWFFRHMVHPPKNSGWLPGTGFANECKAEPLADNHLSSRGVVGFEPAPHIQRIEEKKHRHRAENAPDPPPKSSKNGGRRHSFGCPEGSGGTPKVDLKRDPVPEPMGLVTAAPFLAIFSQNELQNGGPFFRKFAEEVV